MIGGGEFVAEAGVWVGCALDCIFVSPRRDSDSGEGAMLADWTRHFFFGHYLTFLTWRSLRKLLRQTRPAASAADHREAVARVRSEATRHRRADSPQFVVDPPSAGHLEWTSVVLAAYLEVRPDFSSDQAAIDALGEELENAYAGRLNLFLLDLLMRGFGGKPQRARRILDWALRQYGDWFEWSDDVDDGAFTCTIRRCWYFDFMRAHGQPRLTTALCRLDGLWFNRMDPKRHGMRFDHERYTTQGYGSETCVFPIERA